MLTIGRTLYELMPSTLAVRGKEARYIFSTIHKNSSGTIKSPSMDQVFRELDSLDLEESIRCSGKSIKECKQDLQDNMARHIKSDQTPFEKLRFEKNRFSNETPEDALHEKIKIATYVNMLMALNMYSAIRLKFGIELGDRVNYSSAVDYIGFLKDESINDDGSPFNAWCYSYPFLCELYIRDSEFKRMMKLTENGDASEFWKCIFEIFDSRYPLTSEQENAIYTKDINTVANLNNRQIAKMIAYCNFPLSDYDKRIILKIISTDEENEETE